MGKGGEIKNHNLRKQIHKHANIHAHVSVKINNIRVHPKFYSREECEVLQNINIYNNFQVIS